MLVGDHDLDYSKCIGYEEKLTIFRYILVGTMELSNLEVMEVDSEGKGECRL